MVPWGHHRIIIDKCKTIEKCLFYIMTTVENNLSRYDLESRIAAHFDSFDYALFLTPFKSKNDSSSSLLFIGVKVPVLKNKKT